MYIRIKVPIMWIMGGETRRETLCNLLETGYLAVEAPYNLFFEA